MTDHDLSRIQDIPRIQGLIKQVRLFKSLKQAFPFLKPVLKLLGIEAEQMEVALAEMEVLEKKTMMISTLPDRFNNLFASRGWIAYDSFNVDVALATVEKAEAGDLDGAEIDLIEYYNEEHTRWHLRTMQGVKAFHSRFPLAEKALEDYLNGRYHASVPIVLMLLDGFVNDLLSSKGFFSEGTNLEAWDSIAAHSTGLAVLAKILGSGRKKTTTEALSLPYRNGILHGRDLGYDNKMVAAKSWAALFAVREWAYKVEQKEVKAPPEQPAPTWRDIFRTLRDNNDQQSQLKVWHSRSLQIGLDIPASGELESYENGSPEQKLIEYLSYWHKCNYGYMAQCFSISTLKLYKSEHVLASDLAKHYKMLVIDSFKIIELKDSAPAVTTIQVQLFCKEPGENREYTVEYRLLFENEDGKVIVRGMPKGRWGIVSPLYI